MGISILIIFSLFFYHLQSHSIFASSFNSMLSFSTSVHAVAVEIGDVLRLTFSEVGNFVAVLVKYNLSQRPTNVR
jgi:hypothetical protein